MPWPATTSSPASPAPARRSGSSRSREQQPMQSDSATPSRSHIPKFLIVVAITIVMAAMVIAHVHRVNGPWYWVWPWRRIPALRAYLGIFLAALPLLVGVLILQPAKRRPVILAIALVMLGSFSIRIASSILLARDMDRSYI